MVSPFIRDVLDSRGILICWQCKRRLYRYDYKYYPRITLNAFESLNRDIPDPQGNPDCPYCKANLVDRKYAG